MKRLWVPFSLPEGELPSWPYPASRPKSLRVINILTRSFRASFFHFAPPFPGNHFSKGVRPSDLAITISIRHRFYHRINWWHRPLGFENSHLGLPRIRKSIPSSSFWTPFFYPYCNPGSDFFWAWNSADAFNLSVYHYRWCQKNPV